ncbi:MAG: DUF3307 domain-containing protein [Verrucomicrobiales bacterium]|nr:DUF3307 domain-containing protein [Verrucomicrobiales bacterium]
MFFPEQIEILQSTGNFVAGLQVLFALIIAHVLFDYPLQGEFIAKYKNRHYEGDGTEPSLLWAHCLTAHSLMHAGAVWAITGSFIIGVIELILHWIIDFIKCEGITSIHSDQTLHVLCRIGYVVGLALY